MRGEREVMKLLAFFEMQRWRARRRASASCRRAAEFAPRDRAANLRASIAVYPSMALVGCKDAAGDGLNAVKRCKIWHLRAARFWAWIQRQTSLVFIRRQILRRTRRRRRENQCLSWKTQLTASSSRFSPSPPRLGGSIASSVSVHVHLKN